MKKSILSIVLILLVLIVFTRCEDDDRDEQEEVTTSEGIFLDSPVEGLSYISGSLSGNTNNEGKFEYENSKTISFSVGDILLGETNGKGEITPLDLVDGSDVNNQQVRNLASFLQSLDSDNDATNGILISSETSQALIGQTLNFNSGDFLSELTSLIDFINSENVTTLTVVSSNDAALHLATSLGIESKCEFLPRVIEGRQWEGGTYYAYNTDITGEYILKIGSDLTGVRYNFGSNLGFYMDMVYTQDTLTGYGNLYSDLNSEPPVTVSGPYEYRNRVLSPGYVFDYNNDTFIGYYNYFKKEGDIGKLQGTYEAFMFYDKKSPGQDPEIQFMFKNEVIISDPNNDGNFPTIIKYYSDDGIVTDEDSLIIDKNEINNENILLIRFQNTDYLFVNFDINESRSYFFPGLVAIKG